MMLKQYYHFTRLKALANSPPIYLKETGQRLLTTLMHSRSPRPCSETNTREWQW